MWAFSGHLSGHSFFNLSKDTDISEPPYRLLAAEYAYVGRDPSVTQSFEGIDLDALNRDLAQIVNAEKGAIFLATGPVPICGLLLAAWFSLASCRCQLDATPSRMWLLQRSDACRL